MYSLKTHSKRLNVTGIEELAGAEEAEEMSKKLGDHLVRGGCAEEGEGTAQLCKAGSVVAAGTLQRGGCSPTEKTPERELTHGCKPGTQVAAASASSAVPIYLYIRAGALVHWIRWRRLSGCNAPCVEWRRGREYIPMHFIAFRMHLAASR